MASEATRTSAPLAQVMRNSPGPIDIRVLGSYKDLFAVTVVLDVVFCG